MMAATYELIASATAGVGGVASFDFLSIPATYTDLLVTISARSAGGGSQDRIDVKFNNSSADYTFRLLYSNGSSVSSGTRQNFGSNHIGHISTKDDPVNTFASLDIYIPNYAGSSNKSLSLSSAQETNSTTAYMNALAGLWSQTAAIDRLTFTVKSYSNFVQYSSVYLYGITKA